MAVGAIVLAAKKSKRVAAWEALDTAHREHGAKRAKAASETLEALRCAACNAPVPLTDTAEAKCPGCGAAVAIPPAYVELCAARRDIADRLPREAAVLRRARVIGHPLFGVAVIVSAWPAYHAFGAVMASSLLSTGDDTGTVIRLLGGFPLLFLPIALIAAGIGQLLGGNALKSAMPKLAAVRGAGGAFMCRGCNAPLAEAADGVALCNYCGVQNVIAARLAATAVHERGVAGALEDSIEIASAGFWSRFWGMLIKPLYVLGVVGIVVYPILLIVGLTT